MRLKWDWYNGLLKEREYCKMLVFDNLDTTDLSACVQADYLFGKIDPQLYLSCKGDYEKLNYMRFCLAMGIDKEYLKGKTAVQFREIFEEECKARYNIPVANEKIGMAVILASIFDYMGQGINSDYFINHDSGSISL